MAWVRTAGCGARGRRGELGTGRGRPERAEQYFVVAVGPLIELPEVGGAVVVDTETTGTHPDPPEDGRVTIVALAWRQCGEIRRVALPFDHGADRGAQASMELWPSPNLGQAQWEAVLEWLSRRPLVMHDAKFDCTMLATGTRAWPGRALHRAVVWDTMLTARILDPTRPATLDAVEARLLEPALEPEERVAWLVNKKRRRFVDRLEWAGAESYATLDAYVTLRAFEEQSERMAAGEGDWQGWRIEHNLMRDLFCLEQRGIGYDVTTSREAAKQVARAEAAIVRTLPFRRTLPQAKKYFYRKLGVKVGRTTNSGGPALDDQALTELAAREVPYAADYHRLRKLETARTKWFEAYAAMTGWDGRLRTDFSQAQVISGRLSSTRVNLQAIPHDYQLAELAELGIPSPRKLFRPAPGKKLFELDLEQAELRVAAQEARCVPMLELIAQGEDLHGTVATQLFHTHPDDPTWFRDRQIGKRGDFAFIFGVGAETFQATLAKLAGIWLSLHECHSIVQRWRRLYPQYGRAINRYQEIANLKGWIVLANGRPRFFAGYEEKHKAFNQYVQGSLAELLKLWLREVEGAWPGLAVLTIHDSLVLETEDEEVPARAAELGARLGGEMFQVPMRVEVKQWR